MLHGLLGGRLIAILEVDEVAEGYVVAALRKQHFSIVRLQTKAPGLATIEAWTGTHHIFMHVTAAVSPDEPGALTPDEKQELQQRAVRVNAEVWEAVVVLGPDMELLQLDWWPLEEREAGE
jgi:hypothetical protein